MPHDQSPAHPGRQLSVGDARRSLERNEGNLLSRPEVRGVGVGLRDDRPAFIVTVADAQGRDRFNRNFGQSSVGGMPVYVDISSICETSGLAHGHDVQGVLTPPMSFKARIARFVRRLGTIFAP